MRKSLTAGQQRSLHKRTNVLSLLFVVALILALCATPPVRFAAEKLGLKPLPQSPRHVHSRPVARLGGVAIFVAVAITVGVLAAVGPLLGISSAAVRMSERLLAIASIIFLVGLWDDLAGLGARGKFTAQILAAILLYASGFGIQHITVLPTHLSSVLALPLTVLWVVLITNAFNLIDGLDGLAAGSALFSTLVICGIAAVHRNDLILPIAVITAGAIAGFLPYNFSPATIFLGDCGSLLIGFLLSAIALVGSQKSPTMVAVAIPVVSFGLPITDLAVAVARRFLNRKPLFSADREHIHHKLLSRGLSQKQAVLVLYAVTACFGLVSLLLVSRLGRVVALGLALLGIGIVVGLRQLRYYELKELGRAADRTLRQRQVIANNLAIRRAADEFAQASSIESVCNVLKPVLKTAGFSGMAIRLRECSANAPTYPFIRDTNGDLVLCWDPWLRDRGNAWCIRMPFPDRSGVFSLYRSDGRAPLSIDISVFDTTEFLHLLAVKLASLTAPHGVAKRSPRQIAAIAANEA